MTAPRGTTLQTPFARPVAVPTTTAAGVQPFSGDVLLTGWSFAETTGAATALVELWDGNNASGTLLAVIALQPGESTRDLTGPYGIHCRTGLFVNVASGSARGSVWAVDLA